MKANQFSLTLLALFNVLALAGCRRGPDTVKFDKVVNDIPALSTMTYEQAQQKLGAPFNTKTGRAVRGVVRTVYWVTPDQTMGLTGSYDEGTGLPFALSFYLNGTLSTQEELRKATNLQHNDPRLDVSISEAPPETRIRREGEMDIVFYDAVDAKVIALQNTPAEREFFRKNFPQHQFLK
jgi:hypothetical protein